ncbi:efflux transporter outer membrane subunit [Burkholderia plantarii]|uniref:RND efflux system, outer membrane lipoprotein, NodT family n=1 Tax=Burkholderia plantarii TaxID=41899 RepID=A0A0B6RQZ0_BURPL|nr:efflux transporter outer membrane subunit [Burkholderia plantarii]AJK45793.1 RND efflux system, outer membrane lipoprotein, NodT family [Burkholderia plantarii]ALK30043.1 NodT family RND efflux system outer membrane lipoprotein [Burkholderia plantarii]
MMTTFNPVLNTHLAPRLAPRLALAAALAFALAGCAVGPDYKAPADALQPFHHAPADRHDGAAGPAAPLDAWWTGFHDPMLVTIVDRALAQNLDLAAALARVQQARAAASGAGAELLPTFDLEGAATDQHQSELSPTGSLARAFPGYSRNQREYTLGGAASWEIDLAGGLRRNAAAAANEAQAAEADRLGTRVSVAADAADAYLQVRGFQARLAVANDQIATDAQLLELVKARRHAGAADEREVAQADALLRQARALVPTLRTSLVAQLNRLDILMGAQPGTYASQLAVPGEIPGIPSIDASATPTDVLRRRPDVIAAERRLAASNERIGAALSDYYPKLSISGLLGFDSINAGQLFTARAFQPTVTAGLRWRLFDFGKVDAEVKSARGANAEALAQYRQAVLKAAEDVENAFVTLAETQTRRVELDAEVASLTRARDLSQKAYKAGAITLTDVLDADRQLLGARDDLDATRSDAARAAVSVFRALGGGWSTGTASASAPASASGTAATPPAAAASPAGTPDPVDSLGSASPAATPAARRATAG